MRIPILILFLIFVNLYILNFMQYTRNFFTNILLTLQKKGFKLDVHGSVHHNINLIEITNKMRPCSRIYYSNVS